MKLTTEAKVDFHIVQTEAKIASKMILNLEMHLTFCIFTVSLMFKLFFDPQISLYVRESNDHYIY